ncbi:MAG: hypothetical protein KDD69_03585 [Bdellovibrionales bacterium]|nr:hypothetical protein [Bdellovibrionales bacterium]
MTEQKTQHARGPNAGTGEPPSTVDRLPAESSHDFRLLALPAASSLESVTLPLPPNFDGRSALLRRETASQTEPDPLERIQKAKEQLKEGLVHPSNSNEVRRTIFEQLALYERLEQRILAEGADTALLSNFIGELIPTNDNPQARAETLARYRTTFQNTSHQYSFSSVEQSVQNVARLSAELGEPYGAFERLQIAGWIAGGQEQQLFAKEAQLLAASIGALTMRRSEVTGALPEAQERFQAAQESLTALTEERGCYYLKSRLNDKIAGAASDVQATFDAVRELSGAQAHLEKDLSSRQAQLVLARSRASPAEEQRTADLLLLKAAIHVAPAQWREVEGFAEALGQAQERLSKSGELGRQFSPVEQALLRGRSADALDAALSQLGKASFPFDVQSQLAAEQAVKVVACTPKELLRQEVPQTALGTEVVRWQDPEQGKYLHTVVAGDGEPLHGVLLSKAALEKLNHPPEGHRPVLLRMPTAVTASVTPFHYGQGRSIRTGYEVVTKPTQGSRIEADDIGFAREEVAAGRSIELRREDRVERIGQREFAAGEAARDELRTALGQQDAFNRMQREGQVLLSRFIPLQQMLQSGMEGSKTQEYVDAVRQLDEDLYTAYRSGELKRTHEELSALAEKLNALPKGAVSDDFEKGLQALETQLAAVSTLIESNAIEELHRQIQSDAFNADTVGRWMRTNGVVLTCAISGGVLAACAVPTGGASAPAAIALLSLASAAGGYVGSEVGKALVSTYDDSIRSDLQMLVADNGFGKDDYLLSMGTQVGTGFLTSFCLIGAGTFLGNLARTTTAQSSSQGVKEAMARVVVKTADQLKRVDHALEQIAPQARGPMAKFLRESMQEYYEEGAEGGFEWLAATADHAGDEMAARVLKGCAFAFSLLNCAKGPGLSSVSAQQLSLDRVTRSEGAVTLHLSYHGSIEALTEELRRNGITDLTTGANGVVRAATVGSDGLTVVREFNRSTEPYFMRAIRAQSLAPDGSSALDAYELELHADGSYSCSNLQPDGHVSLAQYLQLQGALISAESDDTLRVCVGTEEVLIQPKAKQSDQAVREQVGAGAPSAIEVEASSPDTQQLRNGDVVAQLARLRLSQPELAESIDKILQALPEDSEFLETALRLAQDPQHRELFNGYVKAVDAMRVCHQMLLRSDPEPDIVEDFSERLMQRLGSVNEVVSNFMERSTERQRVPSAEASFSVLSALDAQRNEFNALTRIVEDYSVSDAVVQALADGTLVIKCRSSVAMSSADKQSAVAQFDQLMPTERALDLSSPVLLLGGYSDETLAFDEALAGHAHVYSIEFAGKVSYLAGVESKGDELRLHASGSPTGHDLDFEGRNAFFDAVLDVEGKVRPIAFDDRAESGLGHYLRAMHGFERSTDFGHDLVREPTSGALYWEQSYPVGDEEFSRTLLRLAKETRHTAANKVAVGDLLAAFADLSVEPQSLLQDLYDRGTTAERLDLMHFMETLVAHAAAGGDRFDGVQYVLSKFLAEVTTTSATPLERYTAQVTLANIALLEHFPGVEAFDLLLSTPLSRGNALSSSAQAGPSLEANVMVPADDVSVRPQNRMLRAMAGDAVVAYDGSGRATHYGIRATEVLQQQHDPASPFLNSVSTALDIVESCLEHKMTEEAAFGYLDRLLVQAEQAGGQPASAQWNQLFPSVRSRIWQEVFQDSRNGYRQDVYSRSSLLEQNRDLMRRQHSFMQAEHDSLVSDFAQYPDIVDLLRRSSEGAIVEQRYALELAAISRIDEVIERDAVRSRAWERLEEPLYDIDVSLSDAADTHDALVFANSYYDAPPSLELLPGTPRGWLEQLRGLLKTEEEKLLRRGADFQLVSFLGVPGNAQFDPFLSMDPATSLLLQHLYRQELLSTIEVDLDVQLEHVPLRSQIHLLRYLAAQDTDGFSALRDVLRSREVSSDPELKLLVLNSFVANAKGEEFCRPILELPKLLGSEGAKTVLRKYMEIVDSTESIETELAAFGTSAQGPELIARVTQDILSRANEMLGDYASRAERAPEVGESTSELVAELEVVAAQSVLTLSAYKAVKEHARARGEQVNIGMIRDLEVLEGIPGPALAEYHAQMTQISHANVYSLYADPDLRPGIHGALQKALNNPGSKFYVLKQGDKILQFLRIDDLGDRLYLGSVNGMSLGKGTGVGAPFIAGIVERLGTDKAIELDCWDGTPARGLYVALGFEETHRITEYKGKPVSDWGYYRREAKPK